MSSRPDGDRTGASTPPASSINERLHHALSELDGIARSLDIPGRMERNPVAMLAAAAGLGFVLGGGIFRPFASRLFRAGLRMAVLPLAEQMIARVLSPTGAAVAGNGDAAGEAGVSP